MIKKDPANAGSDMILICWMFWGAIGCVPMLSGGDVSCPWTPGDPDQTNPVWVDRKVEGLHEFLEKTSLAVGVGEVFFKSIRPNDLESFLEFTKFSSGGDMFRAAGSCSKIWRVLASVSFKCLVLLASTYTFSVPVERKIHVLVEKLLGFFLF